MNEEVHFTIIDGENDFTDKRGSLYVPGAEEGRVRVANCVKRMCTAIDGLHVTQDLHHWNDVSHAGLWRDKHGNKPSTEFFRTGKGAPTIITAPDVRDGIWGPAVPDPELTKYLIGYLETLTNQGRYPHIIWPDHCILGSWGSNFSPELLEAYALWCDKNFATLDILTKGTNWKTEHFGALAAEVPDPSDLSTMMNMDVVNSVATAKYHIIAGWASSHCKRRTLEQIVENLPSEAIKKIIYLTDDGDPIPGFEKDVQDHLEKMKALGVTFDTTTGVLS